MSDSSRQTFAGSDLGLDVEQPDDFHIIVEFGRDGAAVIAPDPDAPTPAGLPQPAQEIEARSRAAIDAAMQTIRSMALQTDDMLKSIPGGAQPRMIRVKFGIQLDFQVGAIMAKSGAGATLEVEMEWTRHADDVLRLITGEDEERDE